MEAEITSDAFEQEDGVYVLTDYNFDEFIHKNRTVLVEFCTPLPGYHYQIFGPADYEEAAKKLSGKVSMAKVDITIEKNLAERFKIMGFPSVMFWNSGQEEPIIYDGEPDAHGIIKWLKGKTDPIYNPPTEEVIFVQENGVYDLNETNFEEFHKNNPTLMIVFYVPWGEKYQKFAPVYEEAAHSVIGQIPFTKVDGAIEKKLCNRFEIITFPLVMLLKEGQKKPIIYLGDCEAHAILKWLNDNTQAQPAAKQLHSVNDKFMAAADVSIVGFFPSESGPLFEAFLEASERTRDDFACHYVVGTKMIKQFKAKAGQILIYYPTIFSSKYEPKTRKYPKSDATAEELIKFYREYATPLVGQMTQTNSSTRYTNRPLVVFYFIVDFSTYYEQTQYWREELVKIANKYKDKKYHFAIANEAEFAQELKAFGISVNGFDQNVIFFGLEGLNYRMEPLKFNDELEENLVAFLEDIENGKVKPYVHESHLEPHALDEPLHEEEFNDTHEKTPQPQINAAKQLHSVNDNFMFAADISIVGFFSSENGPLFEAFLEAAERTRDDFGCHYVVGTKMIKHFKAKAGQIFLYYPTIFASKYEPKTRKYSMRNTTTTEELLEFYRENATPLVGQMTRMNSAIRYTKRPLVIVYYNVDFSHANREGTQHWRNKVVEIANKYKDKKYHFAISNEAEFTQELNAVGLCVNGVEMNVIFFSVDEKKYPMDPGQYNDIFEQNIVAFLEDIGNGKVKPYLKNQALPKDNKNPILKAVANNFEKIVKDESKDVLIEFFTKESGALIGPALLHFAKKMEKKEPNLIVAKFDATENDVPEKFQVEEFPTMYFAPAGRKNEPIKYTGNRDLKELRNFLKQNAVKSFRRVHCDIDLNQGFLEDGSEETYPPSIELNNENLIPLLKPESRHAQIQNVPAQIQTSPTKKRSVAPTVHRRSIRLNNSVVPIQLPESAQIQTSRKGKRSVTGRSRVHAMDKKEATREYDRVRSKKRREERKKVPELKAYDNEKARLRMIKHRKNK